ncbi:hypothetical protein OG836_15420 [Micromonospora zamorensis]|uniref:hypothetical protein n=1 Tax=Micromonospora zamorensis TaxID=709883 RepID=UPI002E24C621
MLPLPVDLQWNVDGPTSDLGRVVYEWLDGASAQLLPAARKAMSPLSARVSRSLGAPGSTFGVLAVTRGGVDVPPKTRERTCSDTGFAWLKKELVCLPDMVTLQIGTFDERGHRARRHLVLSARTHPASPGWVRLALLGSDESLDGSDSSLDVQRAWLDVLHGHASTWDPGFGHISYSYGLGATALEDCLPPGDYPPRQRDPEHTVNDCRRYLRGYSWLTIVPKELVARLGGIDELRATSAFARVEQLASGALWLKATERFEDYRGEAVHGVFDALAPVLRPGLPVPTPRRDDQPPHLLVFEDAASR